MQSAMNSDFKSSKVAVMPFDAKRPLIVDVKLSKFANYHCDAIDAKRLELSQVIKISKDEVEVVSRLEIESLVNSAQCPTRVEASVATKDQVNWEVMARILLLTLTRA